ncbi:hypothetical protein EYZ11_004120 [Aspergillus tanneri]|uniref:Uncharacterized protein n=1 Tax=Aspergillus tanneri TaxID=1220188 RepID=A0A4S3JLD6_9EURO|nr:hypothetical protein EYZ11_004120 [Aspergillus tanneri]
MRKDRTSSSETPTLRHWIMKMEFFLQFGKQLKVTTFLQRPSTEGSLVIKTNIKVTSTNKD